MKYLKIGVLFIMIAYFGGATATLVHAESGVNTQQNSNTNETSNNQDTTQNSEVNLMAAPVLPATIASIFPDNGLAEAVAEQLSLSVNDVVSQSDLNGIYELNAENRNISSIDGLEYLYNLEILELAHNNISDISLLKTVVDNQIKYSQYHSINLRELGLRDNNISDISVLAATNEAGTDGYFNMLWKLDLGENNISDVSPLKMETGGSYWYVFLDNNNINDINPLYNTVRTTNKLDLSNNNISDVSIFDNLQSPLTYLNLNNNHISDIHALLDVRSGYLFEIYVENQTVTHPSMAFTKPLSIANSVVLKSGENATPETISNNGSYQDGMVSWELDSYIPEVSYTWNYAEDDTQQGLKLSFSGTIIQPLRDKEPSGGSNVTTTENNNGVAGGVLPQTGAHYSEFIVAGAALLIAGISLGIRAYKKNM